MGDEPFRVSILPEVRDRLASWGDLATIRGLGAEYLADLTFLDEQLHPTQKNGVTRRLIIPTPSSYGIAV